MAKIHPHFVVFAALVLVARSMEEAVDGKIDYPSSHTVTKLGGGGGGPDAIARLWVWPIGDSVERLAALPNESLTLEGAEMSRCGLG